MSRHLVARAEDLPEGARILTRIGGRDIAVFNHAGRLYALRNRCPHQGAPLCEGVLAAALESPAPGVYNHDPSRPLLRCPWHGWEFDPATGQSWFDPVRVRVRSYDVEVVAGAELESRGPQKGPYVAETYPVAVEGAYIVVDVGPRRDRPIGQSS